MNEWDRNNLNFLLSADDATMKEWYKTVTEDDLNYAFELLAMRKEELNAQVVELELEEQESFAEAEAVLRKFKLGA